MKEEEHGIEPENMTICRNTQGNHQWVWNEDQDDYECDECGVSHNNQEEECEDE